MENHPLPARPAIERFLAAVAADREPWPEKPRPPAADASPDVHEDYAADMDLYEDAVKFRQSDRRHLAWLALRAAEEYGISDPATDNRLAEPEFYTRTTARMLVAWANSHPAVTLSKIGRQPLWTDAAPLRHEHDGSGENRPRRLCRNPMAAAEEIAANLADGSFVREIENVAAGRRRAAKKRLAGIGTALYGPEWVSPLARDTRINLRTVQRWANEAERYEPNFVFLGDPGMAERFAQRRRQLESWLAVIAAETIPAEAGNEMPITLKTGSSP